MTFLTKSGHIISMPPDFEVDEATEMSLVAACDVMTEAQMEHMRIRHPKVMLLKLVFPNGITLFSEVQIKPLYKFSGIEVKNTDIRVIKKNPDPKPDPGGYMGSLDSGS